MLNKNDPLIGAVQEVMRKNQAERDAVRAVNEKFGVVDRRALPHEQQANWDAAYAKVLSEGVEDLDEVTIKRMKRELSAAGQREIDARDGFGNDVADRKAVRNAKSIEAKYGKRGLDAVERRAQHGLYGDRIRKTKSMEEELSLKQKKLAKVGNEAGLGGSPTKIDGPDLEGARKGHAKHIEEAGMIPPKGSVKRMIVKAKAGIKSMSASSDKKFADKYHPAGSSNPVDRDINKGATKKADTAKKVYNRLEEEQIDEKAKWRDNPNAMTPGGYAKGNTGEDPLKGRPRGLPGPKGGKTDINRLKTKIKDTMHWDKHKKRNLPEETLEEKAVSKAQHRFFGLVRGIQKGEATGSAKAKEAAASMSAKEVRKFAKTKEKGLPEKKD